MAANALELAQQELAGSSPVTKPRSAFDLANDEMATSEMDVSLPLYDRLASTPFDQLSALDQADLEAVNDPVELKRIRDEIPSVALTDTQHRLIFDAEKVKPLGQKVSESAGKILPATGAVLSDLGQGAVSLAGTTLTDPVKGLETYGEGLVSGTEGTVDSLRKLVHDENAGTPMSEFVTSDPVFAPRGKEKPDDTTQSVIERMTASKDDPDVDFKNYLWRQRQTEKHSRDMYVRPRRALAILADSLGVDYSDVGGNDASKLDPKAVLAASILNPATPEVAAINAGMKTLRAVDLGGKVSRVLRPIKVPALEKVQKVAGKAADLSDAALGKAKNLINTPGKGALAGLTVVGAYEMLPDNSPLKRFVRDSALIGAGVLVAGKTGGRNLERLASAAKVGPSRAGVIERFAAEGTDPTLTQKVFSGARGRIADRIARDAGTLGKSGLVGTAIAPLLGAGNIEDWGQFGTAVGTGFGIGVGAGAFNIRASRAAHQRRAEDADTEAALGRMDPATRANVESLTSFDAVTAAAHEALNRAIIQHNINPTPDTQAKVKSAAEQVGLIDAMPDHGRAEYQRQARIAIADIESTVNGLMGNKGNVKLLVLPEDQIVSLIQSVRPDIDGAQAALYAQTLGMTSDPTQQSIVSAIDPQRPVVLVNADRVAAKMGLGNDLPHVMAHEVGHALSQFPGFKDVLEPLRRRLFGVTITDPINNTTTVVKPGVYSQKDLVDSFNQKYTRGYSPAEVRKLLPNLFDEKGQLIPERAAEYMSDEVMSEMLAGLPSVGNPLQRGLKPGTGLISDLRDPRRAMLDWVTTLDANTRLGQARDALKALGLNPDRPIQSQLLGIDFDPQSMAMLRNALREIHNADADIGSPEGSQFDPPEISLTDLLSSPELLERYKDSGVFETENAAVVRDEQGRELDRTPINIDAPAGTWRVEPDGSVTTIEGPEPASLPGGKLPVPTLPGTTVTVDTQVARQPDGSPKVISAREAERRVRNRNQVIRAAIDSAAVPAGEGRLKDVGNGVYRGPLHPKQMEAIEALPNTLVPANEKAKIRKLSDVLWRGDGTRVLMEYQAALKGGKYRSISPKFRDEVPIGFHFSKDGNFLITTMSVSRLFDKMNAWASRVPERLEPWGGDRDRLWADFRSYLDRHQVLKSFTGDALTTKADETLDMLDTDKSVAERKKNILNDLLNVFTKETADNNPDRSTLKGKGRKRRGDDDIDRIITSRRVDRITDLVESNAEKLPIDYGKAVVNLMPDQASLNQRKAKLPEYESSSWRGDNYGTVSIKNEDGDWVGGADLSWKPSEPNRLYVNKTNVSSDYRGKGYGEALYREIAKFAQAHGFSELHGNSVSESAAKVRDKLFEQEPIDGNIWSRYDHPRRDKVSKDVSFMPDGPSETDVEALAKKLGDQRLQRGYENASPEEREALLTSARLQLMQQGRPKLTSDERAKLVSDLRENTKGMLDDALEGMRGWMTPAGDWVNVEEHRDIVPFYDEGPQIGVDEVNQAGYIRLEKSGDTLYVEHGGLTPAQKRELENAAIENDLELEYYDTRRGGAQFMFDTGRPSEGSQEGDFKVDSLGEVEAKGPSYEEAQGAELEGLLAHTRAAGAAVSATLPKVIRLEREKNALNERLAERPLVDVATLGPRHKGASLEHDVFPNGPGGRVYKIVKHSDMGEYGVTLTQGRRLPTASAYIERLALMRKYLGDDTRIEGLTNEAKPRLVVSQPYIESKVGDVPVYQIVDRDGDVLLETTDYDGDIQGQMLRDGWKVISPRSENTAIRPTQDEISGFMGELGFDEIRDMGGVDRYQMRVGDKLIVVNDAHDGNFILTPEGDVKPIDLIVHEEPATSKAADDLSRLDGQGLEEHSVTPNPDLSGLTSDELFEQAIRNARQ